MKKIFIIIPLLLLLASCSISDITTETDSKTTTIDTNTNLEVTYLNVGKGDAIILNKDDTFVVIDCGYSSTFNILNNALEEKGCNKIDYLIITHFDKDHVGGAKKLINNYEIDTIYTSYLTSESNTNAYEDFIEAIENNNLEDNMTIVTNDITFSLNDVYYEIFSASDITSYTNDISNNSSLCIKATYNNRSFLFAGDAEKQRIKELIKLDISCDVIKIPHHGGIEDNSYKLIEKANPSYSIITSSDSEPEDQELVDLLLNYNSIVYLTRLGDVIVNTDGDNIEIIQ